MFCLLTHSLTHSLQLGDRKDDYLNDTAREEKKVLQGDIYMLSICFKSEKEKSANCKLNKVCTIRIQYSSKITKKSTILLALKMFINEKLHKVQS